ncbi:MAG: transporter, family, hexuronate transporter [Myxococcales bacterium]|nr:transporter, family, hexuronate transporter [Myxococcales bacterium]
MPGPETTSPTPAARAARRGGWGVAIAATLGMSVSYIDRQTLAAIAPSVRSALAIDHAQYGWLLSAFSMAYFFGAPAAGAVVDRLGARRGFAVAVVVWSVVAGAHALVTSFAMLFALRILLGAAEAPSFPAAAQAIRRSLPKTYRSAAYGLLFTGSSIGAMIAAPLALSIEGTFGFRAAFLGTAVIGTAWIPFWLAMTRADRIPAEEIEEADAGGADAARSIYRGPEAREGTTQTWFQTMRSPPVLRAVVAVIGSAPAIMFVLNFSSQYLVEHWHMARLDTRSYLVIPPLFFDVGAVGFGWWASRRERGPDAATHKTPVGIFALAAALAALLVLAPLAPSPVIAMAIFGAAGCGGGGIYVIVTADMLSRVPLSKTSSAGGMTAAGQSLAHIAAGPLVGMAIDRTHSYSIALIALGLLVLPTSAAFALWPGLRGR